MTWDPEHYLRFADHRARPGIELINRIHHDQPSVIVDLGCGPGNLTTLLAGRWPGARVVGVDSSAEMIETARRSHPEVEWVQADIANWRPGADPYGNPNGDPNSEPHSEIDVLYSNAALHWLDDHAGLFSVLRSLMAPGGVMAIQMPDNWSEPTHRIPADVLDDGTWPTGAVDALMRDRLSAPGDYRRWLQPATVDQWRTTYYQELSGPDAVWNWVTGSVLRPVLANLDDDDRNRFATICRQRYSEAYPPDGNGNVLLPFSRLFVVATC